MADAVLAPNGGRNVGLAWVALAVAALVFGGSLWSSNHWHSEVVAVRRRLDQSQQLLIDQSERSQCLSAVAGTQIVALAEYVEELGQAIAAATSPDQTDESVAASITELNDQLPALQAANTDRANQDTICPPEGS